MWSSWDPFSSSSSSNPQGNNTSDKSAFGLLRSMSGSSSSVPAPDLVGNNPPGRVYTANHHHVTNQQQQQQQQHRRNHSTSFESFTASCDDAWDSQIDDCIGSLEEMNVTNAQPPSSSTTILPTTSSTSSSKCPTNLKVTVAKTAITTVPSMIPSNTQHEKPCPSPTNLDPSVEFRPPRSPNKPTLAVIVPLKEVPKQSIIQPVITTISSNAISNGPSTSTSQPIITASEGPVDPKLMKYQKMILKDDVTDMNALRSIAWSGIPSEVRPLTWKILLGYLPTMKTRRELVLTKKRAEYDHLVHQYYNNKSTNDEMWRQIHIDIPRMQPLISIFQQEVVQRMFERILYIWSIRHPASGYVQGMNDLVTPFFVTYLSEFIPGHSLKDVETFEVSSLSDTILRGVEADSFWSFSKLLDSIQDNYTFAQPGIQRMVSLLQRVMSRVDSPLHEHLDRNGVEYLQFSFRWMNNLLIRELPLRCIIRLWDTYLSEGAAVATPSVTTIAAVAAAASNAPQPNHGSGASLPGDITTSVTRTEDTAASAWSQDNGTPFASSFHLFVCAAFLRFWSKDLMQEVDFQGLMLLLQNLPTFHWTEREIQLMVADAYQLKYIFTPKHLT